MEPTDNIAEYLMEPIITYFPFKSGNKVLLFVNENEMEEMPIMSSTEKSWNFQSRKTLRFQEIR
jgi:hypothetical protein